MIMLLPQPLRALLLLALVWPVLATSQGSRQGVEVVSAVQRLVESSSVDGGVRVELEPSTTLAPQDRLVYTIRFTNTTDRQLDNVRVTTAIPSEVRYAGDSASGPGVSVMFSVDGGLRFGAPSELIVPGEDAVLRRADAGDYTHIRWILETPLDPGATAFARFGAVAR